MINILLLMKSMLSVGEDLNKSCRSVMIQLLLLIICTMVQSYAIFRDCENLPALRYCPHVHSSTWEERADCKICPNGTEYHCCKDYDSPKSPPDCPQDDYYCVTEKFVEGCAKVKFCSKGEEPVLSFIENQQQTNKPTVYCVPCHNVNRYNDHSNISSADFSECFEKQNICTPEKNKIECNQSDSTDERYCRCDARNGYSPFNYANDHPSSGCSFENYECKKTIVCPNAQEVLLNYTCGDLCKEGFYRSKDSDVCIPVPTTSSTLMKRKVTKLRNVTTSPLQNTASTVTLADWSSTSTKTTSTLATSVYGSGKTTIIVTTSVGGGVLIIAIIAIITGITIAIIIWCRVWKKRNQGENAGGSRTSGEGGIEMDTLLPVDDGENASGSRTSGEGGREVHRLLPVDDGENASGSGTSGEGGREVLVPLPVDDGENAGGSRTNGEGGGEVLDLLPVDDGENAGGSRTNGEGGREVHVLLPVDDGENASGSRTSGEGGREVHRLLPVDDGENASGSGTSGEEFLPSSQYLLGGDGYEFEIESLSLVGGLEEHRLLLFDDFKCNRDCVQDCLDKSRPFMLKHLEPKSVLDFMKQDLTIIEYRDIQDEYKNSEKIRSLLDKIIQNGPKVYYSFRFALRETQQMTCLNELLKHEKEYTKKIEKRKNSVEDDSES